MATHAILVSAFIIHGGAPTGRYGCAGRSLEVKFFMPATPN